MNGKPKGNPPDQRLEKRRNQHRDDDHDTVGVPRMKLDGRD
jgi:hypothetical protein